jgi:natural product precursor
MKKLKQIAGGNVLSKQQMRKIVGGQSCYIDCWASSQYLLGTIDAGNQCSPIVDRCQETFGGAEIAWGHCTCYE